MLPGRSSRRLPKSRSIADGCASTALFVRSTGEITLERGRVQQGNFDSYDVVRIHEMPQIDVYLVPSSEKPSGAGEATNPQIIPAVTNAIFAATGQRIRKLPIRTESLA